MTELVRYEAARRALAEAVAVDEVLEIRDEWEAIRLAGLVAKDVELQVHAAKIRFRAERRLGELVREQKKTVGLAKGGQPYQSEREQVDRPATLAEAGIDRKLSARAQRIAEMKPDEFEGALVQHETEMRSAKGRVSMDLTKVAAEEKGREHRRNVAQALSDASALQPTGRKYPVIYADPPWHRNQGVTNRSYENHYPTMAWSEICDLPVKDMVLPDAWLFLWIPRAHLLAWHEAEIEATDLRTGEILKVRAQMPLASAVALSWGFESYSTAFVWTKNDDEHPDEAGGAVLVRDQDELLLLFKRGKGLPKPASGEKFGSNHRERSKPLGHSRKPEHYRRMIAAMSGGVPALELFARVDAEHPLPPGWDAWGNQAGASVSASPPPRKRLRQLLEEGGDVNNSLAIAGAGSAPDGVPAGVEPPRDRTADGRSSDEAAMGSHSVAASQFADAGAHAGDRPALSAEVASQPIGEVVSSVAVAGRADAAEPPANRPRREIQDDGLEIPAFLRRTPKPAPALVVAQSEMDLSRRDLAPAEVVDGRLQTRLPLTDDELEMQAALLAIDAGEKLDGGLVRHLVGAGFVHCTSTSVMVTDAGREFLAGLVTSPAPLELEARA
ncbi:MT-A70 family methyltransferase [Bradyrhizobium elkanii]|uniref:MT-A70 family methyltransferase n=1 Tax=Bradyrhizobium elkanii TaxID=29448 RepID=UPI0008417A00|nr:MT-A70 family methyltransferase [Bradyrhizobium elkanii]ODM77773.1 hypothetical protein A6452_34415 [Bradyrhizobium elkanii]ODM81771.1 hypothetical protein A6X20_19100 [Bradyrhizobium elkanii]